MQQNMIQAAVTFALFSSTAVVAQTISVGDNIHVSAARADIAHGEVVLAADPNQQGRLLACSMIFTEGGRRINSAAYVSFDGGRTWAAPVVAPGEFVNDPTCAYGPDGAAYFIAKTVTRPPRRGSDWDALLIHRSADGGRTWERIPGVAANDRPFMALDNSGGKYRGRLYVFFNHHIHDEDGGHDPDDYLNTTRLATSLDGGRSFRYLYDRGQFDQGGAITSSSNVGGAVVLSDGTVAAVQMHALMSAEGSTTGKLRATKAWLQLLVSADGGESIEPVRKIADIQSSYNQANTRTVAAHIAADVSGGKLNDRLYVTWADVRSGRAEILLSWSADKGKTWSQPRVINDDQSRREAGVAGPDHFMPTVAVNKDGIVGVQWYDRRDNPDNESYYVRFAASTDGGETWSRSVRVSTAANSPAAVRQGSYFWLTGGDTAGLAADSQGVFHALWVDNRTGVQQVYSAPLTVKAP